MIVIALIVTAYFVFCFGLGFVLSMTLLAGEFVSE